MIPVRHRRVEMRGSLPVSRQGQLAVHGVLPLLFDHMFGMISHAGRPIRPDRLSALITAESPIDVPLIVRGRRSPQYRGPKGVCVRGTV